MFRSHWYSWPLHFFYRWTSHYLFHCTLQTISDSVDKNERCYYRGKTTLVYNWYGKYRFYPAAEGEKERVRKELGIPDYALVVVSVGGCSHIKRHHDVIKAMSEIVKKHPDAVYLHLGEGDTLEEERALARELHLDDNVMFLGNKKDVRHYLVAADIYLMSSKFEGISLTTIEAMACRIPAILYNVPGLRDFNAQSECSMLIPEDSRLLAEMVLSLYKDKERQETLKNNAQAFVNDKFDMEKNARKIYDLYRGLSE